MEKVPTIWSKFILHRNYIAYQGTGETVLHCNWQYKELQQLSEEKNKEKTKAHYTRMINI